jgi:hypothetical protein
MSWTRRAPPVLTAISAVVGLLGLAVSVALLALKTRAVIKQTMISNSIAGVSALRDSTTDLREIFAIFISRPELRAYFYGRKQCPLSGRKRARVLTIAEMLADALEAGHLATKLAPSSESHEDWIGYCRYMLDASPALASLVQQHSAWWPKLSKLLLGH